VSRLADEPRVKLPLRPLQPGDVISLGSRPPVTSRDPPDLVAPEHHGTMDERAEKPGLVPSLLTPGCIRTKCRFAELDEPRQLWR
jgi:hypothetical protein